MHRMQHRFPCLVYAYGLQQVCRRMSAQPALRPRMPLLRPTRLCGRLSLWIPGWIRVSPPSPPSYFLSRSPVHDYAQIYCSHFMRLIPKAMSKGAVRGCIICGCVAVEIWLLSHAGTALWLY